MSHEAFATSEQLRQRLEELTKNYKPELPPGPEAQDVHNSAKGLAQKKGRDLRAGLTDFFGNITKYFDFCPDRDKQGVINSLLNMLELGKRDAYVASALSHIKAARDNEEMKKRLFEVLQSQEFIAHFSKLLSVMHPDDQIRKAVQRANDEFGNIAKMRADQQMYGWGFIGKALMIIIEELVTIAKINAGQEVNLGDDESAHNPHETIRWLPR